MPSIRDVAEQAGVSPATVSRTFHSPELLNEQTQKRVLDAARLLGYTPPTKASPTLRQRPARRAPSAAQTLSRSLGFLFFENIPQQLASPHLFYAPVLAGAQIEAAALGMHLLVQTADLTDADAPPPLMAVEQAVDGMLLVGAVDRQIVERFAPLVPKVVLVDNRDAAGVYESVASDGLGGGIAAVQYLLGLGHRRIGFLSARRGVPTFQDRLRGYWCGLLEAQITPDPTLAILEEHGEEDSFVTLGRRLLQRLREPDPPTAMLAANDSLAAAVERMLRAEGVRVPEDISLIGFDDLPMAANANPPLTTLHVDREAMGRLAVQRLAALLKAADSPRRTSPLPPRQHTLPVALVVRDSCRAPRD